MTRFTRILTATILFALCVPAQARNWERQAVPQLVYDLDGSDCESLECYGAEVALAAHAAGALPEIIVRDTADCDTLARMGSMPCKVGKPYLMHDSARNIYPKDGALFIGGPWHCNSLVCFGHAAIKLADDVGRLKNPVVLKDRAECGKLNFATAGGGIPCHTAEY